MSDWKTWKRGTVVKSKFSTLTVTDTYISTESGNPCFHAVGYGDLGYRCESFEKVEMTETPPPNAPFKIGDEVTNNGAYTQVVTDMKYGKGTWSFRGSNTGFGPCAGWYLVEIPPFKNGDRVSLRGAANREKYNIVVDSLFKLNGNWHMLVRWTEAGLEMAQSVPCNEYEPYVEPLKAKLPVFVDVSGSMFHRQDAAWKKALELARENPAINHDLDIWGFNYDSVYPATVKSELFARVGGTGLQPVVDICKLLKYTEVYVITDTDYLGADVVRSVKIHTIVV